MKFLVAFGPLRVYIDEVRFITNRSEGVLGYKILEQALLRGHQVRAIPGGLKFRRPSSVEDWIVVEQIPELKKALIQNFNWADVIIMAAAVPDFVPERKIPGKISRARGNFVLKLRATESIIAHLSRLRGRKHKILIGFSLEKEKALERAYEKLKRDRLDLVVAAQLNGISPFGNNSLVMTLLGEEKIEKFPPLRKHKAARYILDQIERLGAKK